MKVIRNLLFLCSNEKTTVLTMTMQCNTFCLWWNRWVSEAGRKVLYPRSLSNWLRKWRKKMVSNTVYQVGSRIKTVKQQLLFEHRLIKDLWPLLWWWETRDKPELFAGLHELVHHFAKRSTPAAPYSEQSMNNTTEALRQIENKNVMKLLNCEKIIWRKFNSSMMTRRHTRKLLSRRTD